MINIQQPIQWAISQPVVFGQGAGVFITPPASDELLVWLKGLNTDDDTAKLDSWAKPDRENMVLSRSACIELDGVAEYGTLDTEITLSGDFEIKFSHDFDGSSVGSFLTDDTFRNYIKLVNQSTGEYLLKIQENATTFIIGNLVGEHELTLSRTDSTIELAADNGVSDSYSCTNDDFDINTIGDYNSSNYLNGKLWNLRLKDATQDTHFPIAEVNGLTSWDTTGTHSITWTPGAGGIAGMRAARQNSYAYNANFEWWGSEGSEIKYPYNPANDYSKLLATSSTIVDVFIYDTSKDSDGGAWRGSTSGASWYNETLGTATRGGTREFPAVAFIVAETTKVTIFDATDPVMPMWMVIPKDAPGGANATMWWRETPGTPATSVSMLNGTLCIGIGIITPTYNAGLLLAQFIKDDLERYSGIETNSNRGTSISERGSLINLPVNTNLIIADSSGNDVAMTVLPDAPIDPETGIAVPTIAVATDGGVSVIDGPAGVGTVVDSAMTGASGQVYFDNVGGLWYGRTDQTRLYSSDDYSSDIFLYQTYRENKVPATLLQIPVAMDINVSGGASGLTLLKENTLLPSAGMVCYLTDSYISGWMQGDIELCLSGENLTDKSVNGITVTDNGSATFATVNTETDLQATTATGGTITATVPTGRVCYGWELVSGSWVFNKTIGDFVGVSEAGGTLTIADGTTFTLLKYTSGTPSDDQFTDIYTTEKELFKDGAKCTLTSSNVTSLSYDESESALFVGTPSNITRVDGLVTTIERTPFNTKAIDFKGGENVSASTTEAASGYTIETIKYPAGTMNYPESLMAFEEKPVGSFDGIGDKVTLDPPIVLNGDYEITLQCRYDIPLYNQKLFDASSGTRFDLNSTGGVYDSRSYVTAIYIDDVETTLVPDDLEFHTIRIIGTANGETIDTIASHGVSGYLFTGIIRDVNINGTLIPINEGSGTDIHDSDGNIVGTLTTGDSVAFWTDAAPMVSQAVMDMEADQGVGVFTDLAGHSVPMSQATIDTVVNNNDQYFRKNCVGSNPKYFFYKTVQTGDNLTAIKDCCCIGA